MGGAAPIIIGISGGSGAAYGIRLPAVLQLGGIRTHLVVSKSALQTLKEERDLSFEQVRALAETTYHNADLGAAIGIGRLLRFRDPEGNTIELVSDVKSVDGP